MLLVVDVGNTNITLGVFNLEILISKFRMTTGASRTSDEFGIAMCAMLERQNIPVKKIEAVIIGSVVPDIMHSLINAFKKYFEINPLVIGPGTKTGIKVATYNPKEVGADRIIDLVAAYEIYGGPTIVIDFGTATTYDLITEEGVFSVGITAPGIGISAKALWQDAAKLPKIEIKKPKSILAKETISSMQAGLVYGTIGEAEYIIRKIKEESQLENIKTVATGGLGKIIAESTKDIDVYDVNLTLNGMRLIYNKNK
jgi:pantothenate kinase, type III